jgi:putative ABC transport system permease protein
MSVAPGFSPSAPRGKRETIVHFILAMAARETRAAWKRLLFFFVCIAVGVGSIVALRSVIQSARIVLTREARTLLAADVMISTSRAWPEDVRRRLDARIARSQVLGRTESIETPTMVRPEDPARRVAKMVELRAVQRDFPLHGAITLQDGRPYAYSLLEHRGALVRPELLAQLGVSIGDRIVIGRDVFTIRGTIASEPGRRAGAFSLGPRVLIDFSDLQHTGLITFGSRANYQILLRLADPDIAPLVRDINGEFREQFVSARSFRTTEDAIGEGLVRTENYLSLVALIIVVLGGIGVSSVTRVFMQQKIKSIAILKCLGAGSRQVLAVYLLQVIALGLAGSLLGVGLAGAAIAAIPERFQTSGDVHIEYALTLSAVAQGLGVGVIVSLLFALVPLLDVRHVKPSLLLRQEGGSARRVDVARWAAIVLLVAGLVGLASWQSASLRIGLIVSVGFAGLALVLHLAGLALVRAAAPLTYSSWFPLRQASLRLSRPGNQTRVILLAVGLGSFFIIGVRSMQTSLLRDLAMELSDTAPDMFLIDIQRDQAARMRQFLDARLDPGAPASLIPVLRARVTGVRGSDVNLERYEDVRGRGSLAREYVITYRGRLEPNETVVQGTFWTQAAPPAEPEVSIEQGIHERFKINVGDTMRFDVLGRTVSVRVSSIRAVEWKDSRRGGFMFVFTPGLFEDAPQMFIAPLKAPADLQRRGTLQHDLVEAFPNVSVIDLREILENVKAVIRNVTLAITVVGLLVGASGGLILIGAVAMTKFQRVYEAAIFKTLGASTRALASMLVLEYGLLGTLAGLIGSLGAIALNWGVSRYALDLPWRLYPWVNVAGVAITALLVAAVGVGSSLDVLRRKPLATLRAE